MKNILKRVRRLTFRPEQVFLMIAIPFGVALVFTIAPLHGNDEIVHFPRAYHVQEGNLWTDHLGGYDYGGQVPKQLKAFNDGFREQVQTDKPDQKRLSELKQQYGQERIEGDEREGLAFSSAGVYSAWAYAPAAVGIFVADSLNLPLNWFIYLGRLFTLATYITLVYFAIRWTPFGKLFLLIVALLPTALTQGGTIGMDGLVNGLSWLIIALSLAIFTGHLKLSKRLLLGLGFASLFLATTKQAYGAIALLPLLLPARLYPISYRQVWLWRGVFALLLIAITAWYIGATSHIASIIHYIQRPGLYVDESDQLHYVFQNSLGFMAMILAQPFNLISAGIYGGMVGVMTNRTVFIPIQVTVLLLLSLVVMTFHREKIAIQKRDRLYLLTASLGAFFITYVLIHLGLYLSFTQVGFPRVEGLQGRYFLPLLPLIGVILHLLMPKLFFKLPDRLIQGLAVIVVLTGLISALIVL